MTVNVTAHGGWIVESTTALRETLSQSYQIQEWLDVEAAADPPAAANAAIEVWAGAEPANGKHYTDAEQVAKFPRVFIALNPEGVWGVRKRNRGTYDSYGSLSVILERLVTEAEADSSSLLLTRLATTAGRIAEEIWEASGSGRTLAIEAVDMTRIGRLDERDAKAYGEIAVISFDVTFGRSSG